MKSKSILLIISTVLIFSLQAFGGSLEPSAPPGSTMKTLDEVEPRIPIQSLSGNDSYEYIIISSGSYYLTGDVDTEKSGIRIGADNVNIDLMGFTLKGPDSGLTGLIRGIYVLGSRSNVVIRNGTVRDFDKGIYLDYAGAQDHQVIDIRAISNTLSGIYLKGSGHLVKNCTVSDNGKNASPGRVVYGIRAGYGSIITGNTVRNNGYGAAGNVYSISATIGSTVTGNMVSSNGHTATGGSIYGIFASQGSTVTGNTVYDTGVDSTGNVYGISGHTSCTFTANTIIDNSGGGLKISGSGSFVAGNIVKNNADNYNIEIEEDNQINILLCEIPESIDWPAMVTLSGSLKSSGNGITVTADDVTIDLAGHTLKGIGSGYGIYMDGRNNVEVRNGTIREFKYGIYEADLASRNHRIINVRSVFNGEGGIVIEGEGHFVKDCSGSDNGASATNDVYGIKTGYACTIINSTAHYNGYGANGDGMIVYGIKTGNGSTVTGNLSRNNGKSSSCDVYGMSVRNGCTVIGNTVYSNGKLSTGTSYGIFLGPYCLVDKNTSYSNEGTNMNNPGSCAFGLNIAP